MHILGLDLAEHCGWAIVDVFDKPIHRSIPSNQLLTGFSGELFGRVIDSGMLDLAPERGHGIWNGKMPSDFYGAWIAKIHKTLYKFIVNADVDAIAVEAQNEFLFGMKNTNSRTIFVLINLQSQVQLAHRLALENKLQFADLEFVSTLEWQDSVLTNVPAATQDKRQSKSKSKAAAWFNLAFATENDNISDACLLAMYYGRKIGQKKMLEKLGRIQ